MAMAAIAAVGVGVSVYGLVQSSQARKEYQENIDNAPDPTNPYAGLQPSTLGSQYRGAQALRSEATQMNLLSKAGSRGLAMVPQVARGTALIAQSEAADLDRQRLRIEQLKGQGSMFTQNMEEARLNRNLEGSSQLYATGQQNVGSGINLAMGALASGFSEGGDFTQQQPQQLRPYATGVYPPAPTGTNLQSFQPTLRPQQLINS